MDDRTKKKKETRNEMENNERLPVNSASEK